MVSVVVGAFLHPSPLLSLISTPCHPLLLRCTVESRRAVRSLRWPAKLNNSPALRYSFQSQPESAAAARNEGREDEISRATLIWRAAKLPIYSVALVPLSVGSAAAYLHTGLFSARRYLLLLFSSFLIIAWLNLSNDVYDYDTGVDQDKKESVVNMIGSRTTAQFAAITSIVLGFMGLIWAFAEAGDIRFILLVTSAILCGYVYQCPPFRLGYHGLGEPLCFAAFGPFATTAFYFSQNCKKFQRGIQYLPLNSSVLSASVLVGLTTSFILFCSHFHQIDGDKAVGKMSPLVRVGTEAGSKLIRLGILVLYTLMIAFSICKALPLTCTFLCIFTVPIAKLVIDFVEQNHADKVKIFMAKYYCVQLHGLFGAALSVGLVFARGGLQTIS